MIKKTLTALFTFSILFSSAHAWSVDDKKSAPKTETAAMRRLGTLSSDDRRRFESLSAEQKNLIINGKIEKGFNEWMVKLALGEPFYGTEHHPIFTDYEEVWLYTKPKVTEDVQEETINDPATNWPTVHRKTQRKTCNVSDYFVLWDRGVVQDIKQTNDEKQHGTCVIEISEAYLPIVNGKPVEPKK